MNRTTLRRWMPAALIVSLGVNMFFAGLAVSHFDRPGPPPGGPPGPERFFEHLASTLPAEDGAKLLRALDANREAMRAERDLREAMRQRISAALLAEPFDPKALAAVFADTDRRERELRLRMQGAIAEAAAAMSPEGRRRMAEFRPPHPPGPGPGPGDRR